MGRRPLSFSTPFRLGDQSRSPFVYPCSKNFQSISALFLCPSCISVMMSVVLASLSACSVLLPSYYADPQPLIYSFSRPNAAPSVIHLCEGTMVKVFYGLLHSTHSRGCWFDSPNSILLKRMTAVSSFRQPILRLEIHSFSASHFPPRLLSLLNA